MDNSLGLTGTKLSGYVEINTVYCYHGNLFVKLFRNVIELPHRLPTEDNFHLLDVFSITGKILDLIQYLFHWTINVLGIKVHVYDSSASGHRW
jgi:hypothetical protein